MWDLKWCPTRASTWDLAYVNSESDGDTNSIPHAERRNIVERLGLLAAAFSDGCVRIYSVPYPPHLHQNQQHDLDHWPIFVELEPVATLRLYESNVTSINWSPHGHHELLLAGYSDGVYTHRHLP